MFRRGRRRSRPERMDTQRHLPDELDFGAVVQVVIWQRTDVDGFGFRRPVAVKLDGFETDHQDEVTLSDVVEEPVGAERLNRPDEEWVILPNYAFCLGTNHHWDHPLLGQR